MADSFIVNRSSGGDEVIIDKAVIIKEADAKYILHDFKQVEYLAGNKIGYAGPGNQIIVGGYVFYKRQSDIIALGSAPYTSAVFGKAGLATSAMVENCDFYMSVTLVSTSNAQVALASEALHNSQIGSVSDPTYDLSKSGLGFIWSTIFAPNGEHPYGYVFGTVNTFVVSSTGRLSMAGHAYSNAYFDFASMAEYEAAVGLTYEPLTLTRVEDNPTIM